jgi:16S rRNA (guanine527-N7)-methyltransferase
MPDLADLGALNTAVLRQGAKRLGVPLDVATVAAFERYAAEMVAWNTRVNLTRILRPDEIAVRHFLDSLVCLRGLAPEEADHPLRCIDVGAGAGLPGIPLKLVRPAWSLALVESVGKKVAFLEHLVGILRLPDVLVLHARAEDVGRDPAHRERFHLAVARAVARLPVLAELLLPLVRPGGRVITLKGEDIADEVRRSEPVLRLLGGELFEVQPYHLPGLRAPRHLVVVAKTGTTPPAYPRRAGVPERQPLA